MRNIIEGYNELEKKLGYEPNFHDDHIEKVTIIKGEIIFELRTVDNIFYSLIFEDIQEINLKGDFKFIIELGVILDIEIAQINGMIKSVIESSLGLCGEIIAKRLIVE